MSISSFRIAVTGMLAQSSRMSVIGNNIANSRTIGYKRSELGLSEDFVVHYGQFSNGELEQYGNGVRTMGVTTDWGSGAIEGTGTASHIAIMGDGFFPVNYNNSIYYTRAGDFSLVAETDASGAQTGSYIFQRADGAILLGAATPNTAISTTSYVQFDGAPNSYNISSSGLVTAEPSEDVYLSEPTPTSPGMPNAPGAAPAGGGTGSGNDWDALTSGEHTHYATYAATQTGAYAYDPGWNAGLGQTNPWDPQGDGEPPIISEITVTNAYVGLQRFNNPDSLKRYEGGLYLPTDATSASSTNPVQPGTQGSGSLLQGSLENSNVDLVAEFTDMIITERAFQANAKTITTADEMLQTVLALKR